MFRNSAARCCQGNRLGPAFAVLFLLLCLLPSSAPHLLAQNTAKARKVVLIVQPDYPTVVKNGHFEGQVRLEASVLANGTVSKVEIRGGNPMLAQFTVEAVMKWKYVPGPAPTVEEVTFNFHPR
jgi:TonB family protein